METLKPDQATLLLQTFVASLSNEHETTKKVIAAVPADKGDYRPDPNARSAFELAWHIASAENMFLEAVAAGQFIFTGRERPASVRNSADIVRWYDERFKANIARLKQLSAEQLVKILDFRGIFQFPAVYYLFAAVNHSVHHRGQLSVYLRPMGSKVPAIYGESYDSAQARAAAPIPA